MMKQRSCKPRSVVLKRAKVQNAEPIIMWSISIHQVETVHQVKAPRPSGSLSCTLERLTAREATGKRLTQSKPDRQGSQSSNQPQKGRSPGGAASKTLTRGRDPSQNPEKPATGQGGTCQVDRYPRQSFEGNWQSQEVGARWLRRVHCVRTSRGRRDQATSSPRGS